ncbi:proline--tRNA ligase [Sporichthya brevicatena]|uniref:Proline--tRNA ligase n=1 Tax=Sporichthya brevicatena TaxID=171442 RepID=A0ABN1H7Q2_9ACTN
MNTPPLRLSQLFLRTLREDPSDSEAANHRLLVRAGYLRRAAPGVHAWLPLGRRVLDAVEHVLRTELAAIGGQEVALPVADPDRLAGVLALLRAEISSYRDLPVTLFQIQPVVREESRPRGGLLRAREYVAHHAWSFDIDSDGLQSAYNRHRALYMRLLERVGLDYRIVAAPAGAGEHAEHFLAATETGEDVYVTCGACDYAAASAAVRAGELPIEAIRSRGPAPAPEEVDTPDTPTIESLADRLGVPTSATLKNLLLTATAPDGTREVVAVGVPGDREVDLARVEAALAPARVELFTDADFAEHPGLVRGYIGPQGLAGKAFRYLADPRIAPGTAWVTGANAPGRHVRNLVAGRDFAPERYVDLVHVRDDDPCPACGGRLRLHQGIAVARIARLGRRAGPTGVVVLGRDGRNERVAVGSYALGVTRLIGAIVEQHHDEAGICWPPAAAPADVHLVAAGRAEGVAAAAERLAAEAGAAGLRVLIDDRAAVSAGVKFADAELLGLPVIVVVGRGLAAGLVEIRDRRAGTRSEVALPAAVAAVRSIVSA